MTRFGDNNLNNKIMKKGEEFLRECVRNKNSFFMDVTPFDSLRHFIFHSGDKKTLTKKNYHAHLKPLG